MKLFATYRIARFTALTLGPLVAATAVLLLAPSSTAGPGKPHEPDIVPPHAHAYGKTYSEWAAAWWQWATAIPASENPILDETGDMAMMGQQGPVWFLGGVFNATGTAERTCTIPDDTALLFPILNYSWISTPGDPPWDRPYTDPATGTKYRSFEAYQRLQLKLQMDAATGLACEIDGVTVKNLAGYRVQSVDFNVTMPADNIFGVDFGQYGPSADDGYYLLLEPLPVGQHTIHFKGTIPGFSLDITYHLTVQKFCAFNPGVIPPELPVFGKTYSDWSAEWWEWAYSLPVTGHPLFDATGANAAAGQSGPVWFLGGTFTMISDGTRSIGLATRNITVPAGKFLFFPILNTENNNWGIPPTTSSEDEMRPFSAWIQDHAANMTCTIDGRAVTGLNPGVYSPYRVQSPRFHYKLPAHDNLIQYWGYDVFGHNPPPGDVSDGVYLMLAPLSPGNHVIHFKGDEDIAAWSSLFSLDITYNITVKR